MVTEWLIEAVLTAFRGLLSLLPVVDLDTAGWDEHARSIFTDIGQLDGWLPIDELFIGLGLMIAARVAVLLYKTLRSIWDALPLT